MNAATGPRGRWRGGTFTVTTHIEFGSKSVATPDGRADRDPIAEAISPRQGFDKNGPTSYLLSASKLPHMKLGNGDMLNIRFSPTAVRGEHGTLKLRHLISTYFDQGGMQVQYNVVSTETLHNAQQNPEKYENLIVRIAGFSVYFVEMPKIMQDDFITRTEHSV
jgi:formate C-acetyltransferase